MKTSRIYLTAVFLSSLAGALLFNTCNPAYRTDQNRLRFTSDKVQFGEYTAKLAGNEEERKEIASLIKISLARIREYERKWHRLGSNEDLSDRATYQILEATKTLADYEYTISLADARKLHDLAVLGCNQNGLFSNQHTSSSSPQEHSETTLPPQQPSQTRPFIVTPPQPKYEVHVRLPDGRWVHEKDASGMETSYRFVVLYKELGWDHDFIQIADSQETVDIVKRLIATSEANDVRAGRLIAEYLSPTAKRESYYGREIVAILRALTNYDRSDDPLIITRSDAQRAYDALPENGGLEDILKVK